MKLTNFQKKVIKDYSEYIHKLTTMGDANRYNHTTYRIIRCWGNVFTLTTDIATRHYQLEKVSYSKRTEPLDYIVFGQGITTTVYFQDTKVICIPNDPFLTETYMLC